MTRSAADPPVRRTESHLFTVRLWTEELAAGQFEWRGKVTHVLSGETRYFREWPALLAFLSTSTMNDEAVHPAPDARRKDWS